jgi:hypothetical protein
VRVNWQARKTQAKTCVFPANLVFITEPAAASAAATTTAATVAASSAATPAAIAAPAAAREAPAPAALAYLRTGLIHVEGARTKLRSVDAVDCLFGFFVVRHFYKAKASRLASITVFQNRNVIDLSESCKSLPKLIFRDVEIQIAYINILHAILLK